MNVIDWTVVTDRLPETKPTKVGTRISSELMVTRILPNKVSGDYYDIIFDDAYFVEDGEGLGRWINSGGEHLDEWPDGFGVPPVVVAWAPVVRPWAPPAETSPTADAGLFCNVCGLPVVPFGGEDICLDPSHEETEGMWAGMWAGDDEKEQGDDE